MFERLIARAGSAARGRAEARAAALAERLDGAEGVRAELQGGGVTLSGRGLLRRLVRDPGFRNRLAARMGLGGRDGNRD